MRTGLVVLAAALAQLVIIGAVCNQWVTKRAADSIPNETSRALRNIKVALLTYNWRFTPQDSDHQHIWLGQTLLILTTLVVSCVVIAVVVQGPSTFVRAWFGAWTAIAFATMLGAYVRGLVNDAAGTDGSRLTRAVFGPLGPNAVTFFAGLVLGFVVGLIAGVMAVTSRRSASVRDEPVVTGFEGFHPQPEQPPPYYGSPDSPPWQDQHFSPSGRHAAPPSEPGVAGADQPTTEMPTVAGDEPTAERSSRPPDDGEATTQFPRVPEN